MRASSWFCLGVVGLVVVSLVRLGHESGSGAAAPEATPRIVPGTAKITVTARFRDGQRPVGTRCHIQTWSQAQPPSVSPVTGERLRPTVGGADGDWVIYNVGPGQWSVSVNGDDCASTVEHNTRHIEVTSAEPISLAFTLLRGGSITGRVVRADTGEPLEGVLVVGDSEDRCKGLTDAQGRYTVHHLVPRRSFVVAKTDPYVPTRTDSVEVKDEATVSAPDIRLRPGGWISGRVPVPEGAPQWVLAWGGVTPRLGGKLPPGAMIFGGRMSDDGTFRLGPLPPGSYTVEATASTGKVVPVKRWRGEVKGIQVEVGKETGDVVVPLAPVVRQ